MYGEECCRAVAEATDQVHHIDERENAFVSSRKWPSSFQMLLSNGSPLLVYDHPVYDSNITNKNESDLVMFLGRRWVITSKIYLTEIGTNNDLVPYLEKQFHGNWSNYTVSFFSESVTIDTPQDSMNPVGLNWFAASPKITNENQFADENRNVKSLFLYANYD